MEGGGGLKGRSAAAPRTTTTPTTTTPLLPLRSILLATLLILTPARANDCLFPKQWDGRWYQLGKQGPVIANSTHLLDRKCIEKSGDDSYLTYEENLNEGCYRCMIITERDKNVIQYRESYCTKPRPDLSTACSNIPSDDVLISMFRLDSEPIPCPFTGTPFSFSYSHGNGQECQAQENQAESCTDDSKLLLKYQACADVQGTESRIEELQCLATWKDGRNQYMVGTMKSPDRHQTSEEIFKCFLYEKIHRQGKIGYRIAQSGEASCSGVTSANEGARTFVFTKEDKEHVRCKYPTWVTQHHVWHFLDGSRNYHFTTGNSTLKVTFNNYDSTTREEKVVCHNLEKMNSNDNMQGPKVKLVAHVTSGCDTGYVCMIFHKRDGHVIEVQQSSQKVIMPHEACSLDDPSKQPFSTLITSTLHKRSCPQPGRYTVLDLMSAPQLKLARRHRRFARSSGGWREDSNEAGGSTAVGGAAAGHHDDDCQNADVQIGCKSSGQNEMIIQESCKRDDIVSAYSCHGSWEENGTWYTIVSRNKNGTEKETLCVSMKLSESTKELPGRVGRVEQQELWLSRPQTFCQRGSDDQWTYKLANQGVCEDLMRAASASSSSLARVSIGLTIIATLLCRLLSR